MTAWAAVRVHGRVARRASGSPCTAAAAWASSAVMIAAAAGARVVAVDIDREKLGRARRLGAEAAVDARAGGVEAVLEATGGGAHVSLDALGQRGDVRRVGRSRCASAAATSRSA